MFLFFPRNIYIYICRPNAREARKKLHKYNSFYHKKRNGLERGCDKKKMQQSECVCCLRSKWRDYYKRGLSMLVSTCTGGGVKKEKKMNGDWGGNKKKEISTCD